MHSEQLAQDNTRLISHHHVYCAANQQSVVPCSSLLTDPLYHLQYAHQGALVEQQAETLCYG
jgi:hypothetical protein